MTKMSRVESDIHKIRMENTNHPKQLGLIVMFDETMILPAIPDFIRDFNISYRPSSWLLSAYIIRNHCYDTDGDSFLISTARKKYC